MRIAPLVPDAATPEKGTCSIISLGCPKNLVDSERMLGLLRREGYQVTLQPEQADFVIVNTCAFLEVARQESIQTTRQMVRLKKQGSIRGVIVAGCLAQWDQHRLLDLCPGVDQVVGLFGRDQICEAVARIREPRSGQRTILPASQGAPIADTDRFRLTPPHLAYLRIAEGCDRLCTFCLIRSIKGKFLSKPIDQVLLEAEQLLASGARELILIAQDTGRYGADWAGGPQLARLVSRLAQLDRLEWLRLMYLYPTDLSDELIELLACGGKVLPYLDLPLQHASDPILRRMKRQVSLAEMQGLLNRLRRAIPGLVLRTTLMVGFPGETQEDFDQLRRFVLQWRFERLGVFVYSREPGTPAARLPDQVAPAVARARRQRLMATQQEIAFAWGRSQVGKKWDILIDGCIPGQPDAYIGRSYADAPEVDGVVYLTGEGLRPGQLVPCEIVAAQGYDLVAVAVGDPR